MANVVDFSQLRQKVTPWGEALLDPITEELQRRQKQADAEALIRVKHEGDMAQQERLIQRDAAKAQHDREVERLNNDRFVGEQTIKEGDRRAATEEKIRQDIGRDDNYDAAEQRAKSYQSFDPKTGAVTQGLPGFKLDRGIAPGEPSPELSAVMGGEADAAMGAFPALAGAGVAAKEKRADQQVEYGYKQQHPDIMIAGVPTTRDALRYSAARANAADMKRVEDEVAARLATTSDPRVIEVLKGQLNDLKVKRAAVEAGLTKPGEALKGNDAVAAGISKQQGAEALQGMKNESAANVAGIRAETAGAANSHWEQTNQRNDDKEERQKRVALRGEVSQLAGEFGIKDAGKTIRGLEDLQQAVGRGATNSADAARAVGRWVQLAQRDSRISNQDIPVFFGRIGGIEKYGGDPFAMLDAAASGKLQPEVIPQILDAAKAMLDRERGNVDEFLTAGDEQFGGFYGKHWQDFRRGLMGMGTKKAAAGTPPPGRPQRDAGNPDDPNAPDAGRPLDGDGPAQFKYTEAQVRATAARNGLDVEKSVQRARQGGLIPP